MKLSKEEFIMRVKNDDRIPDEAKISLLEDIDDSMEIEVNYEGNPDYVTREEHEAVVADLNARYIERFGVTAKEKESSEEIEDEEDEEKVVELFE